MPTGPPSLAMWPAVMPMFALPGLMMPGQFGPSSCTSGKSRLQLVVEPRLVVRGHALGDHDDELDATLGRVHHRVAHTRRGDEDAGPGAPVSRTASATVAKIGMPSTSVPAFFGFVPATTCVPYSRLSIP